MTTTHDDATLAPVLARLRDAALAYPEAVEEFPWGDRVVKVRGKIFVFLNIHEGQLRVTTKLPQSGEVALMLPFVEPTGYGLGKSGWVTARFGPDEEISETMLLEWIDESYRAVAPKRLLLGGAAPSAPKSATPARKGTRTPSAAQAKPEARAKKAASAKKAAPARRAQPSRKQG